jgi:hypothetical protein
MGVQCQSAPTQYLGWPATLHLAAGTTQRLHVVFTMNVRDAFIMSGG